MSKVGRQNSGTTTTAMPITGFGGGRVTRASSTSTSTTTTAAKTSQGKSIVSIEVNMESSSSSMSSYEKPLAPPPPPGANTAAAQAAVAAVKKKRLALGNLSNATEMPIPQNAAAGQANNGSTAPKDAKKYRFSGANFVNIASGVMPGFGQKKADQLAKKTSIKSSSKENLHQLPVPARKTTAAVANKKPAVAALATTELSKTSVSKSENDIKRQVDSLTISSEVSTSSSTMNLTSSSSASTITTSMSSTNVSSTTVVPATTTVLSSSVSSLDQQAIERVSRHAELVANWEDIDANDASDEFACAEYAVNIFKYYRDREDVFGVRDYLNSPHANINRQMRVLLVDWMVEVQQQLEFNHEVLYLSVKLLDLYLTRQLVDKEKLQLLAAASMFIACKFEERMPPVIEDFILVSDNAYERRDIIKMEIEILKTVKFDLGVPLSYTFLRRYSKCIRADMKFLTLARYILELSLQDYSFAPERDSLKACAALYLAMKMAVSYEAQHAQKSHLINAAMSKDPNYAPPVLCVSTANLTSTEWNPTLVHYTNAFVQDFAHLIQPMNNLVRSAPTNKYRTIFRKYSHSVFFEVAKVPALSDYQVDLIINSTEMVH